MSDRFTDEDWRVIKHLSFIYYRLKNIHGENPNVDYMFKLKETIKRLESEWSLPIFPGKLVPLKQIEEDVKAAKKEIDNV